jgi:centrin-1
MERTSMNSSRENRSHSVAGEDGVATLSRMEQEDLREAFSLFDTEQKGRISVGELRSVLKELGQESMSMSSSLKRVLKTVRSLSPDQELSLDDFSRMLTAPDPSDDRDELQKVFDLFDGEQKGYITVDDLHKVAADLGESMSDEELKEMVHRASDSNKVTYEQFTEVMNKKLFS